MGLSDEANRNLCRTKHFHTNLRYETVFKIHLNVRRGWSPVQNCRPKYTTAFTAQNVACPLISVPTVRLVSELQCLRIRILLSCFYKKTRFYVFFQLTNQDVVSKSLVLNPAK